MKTADCKIEILDSVGSSSVMCYHDEGVDGKLRRCP